MKNLRKVLSFVLVLAMVLGMVTTAFAATTFTDAGKISNVEAATVLNAIGVLEGFPDGTFGPAQTLTRAQGATIIARLVLGKDAANKLVAVSAPFSDVATSNWAAGYISWAAANGIVNGMGNGKFDPNGTLTVTQFAKMCLTALGYKSEYEGFTGENWANNVSAAANKAGVLKDVVITADACTRDVAAQMAFNVLKGTEVEYYGGTSVKVDNTTVTVNASRRTLGLFLDNNTKLTAGAIVVDDFGRPAHSWTNDGKAVGTFADKAKLTYTAEVALGTIYTDLGLTAATTVSAVKNGTTYAFAATNTNLTKGDTTTKVGGNGTLTEVYKDLTTGGYKIVMIETFVGIVDYVTEATATTERNITISAKSVGAAGGTYETKGFAKKDVVSYNLADGVIKNVALLTKAVEGEKVTKTVSGTSFDVAGVTYKYSAQKNAQAEVSAKVDAYLDAYGYALYVVNSETTTNYAAVVGVGSTSSVYGESTKKGATLLLADGTLKETYISYKDAESGSFGTLNTASEGAVLVTYTVNADGVYEVAVVTNSAAGKFGTVNGKSAIVDSSFYGNDATVYFVASKNGTKGYTTYNVYTGYKNVPTITSGSAQTCAAFIDANTNIAKAVYIAANSVQGTESKNIVVVKSAAEALKSVATETSSYSYYELNAVVDGASTTVLVEAGQYALLATGTNLLSSSTVDKNNVITNFTVATGYTTAEGIVAPAKNVVGIAPTALSTNGTVTGGTYYAYDADMVVVTVAKDFKSLSLGTVDGISTDKNDIVTYKLDTNSKTITEIYIQVVEGSGAI